MQGRRVQQPRSTALVPRTVGAGEPDMIKLQDVCYVRLGTADLDGAAQFATEYLGLEISHRSKNAIYLKSDQREHTLCYFAGSPADQTTAFEVCDPADLEAAASELERLGHHVRL